MVTLPFPDPTKRSSRSGGHHHHRGRRSKASSTSSSSFDDPTCSSLTLMPPPARRELFGGGVGIGGPKSKATTRRHRGMILLKDSVEEEQADEQGEEMMLERTDETVQWGGGAADWPSSSYGDSAAEKRPAEATTTATTTTADLGANAAGKLKSVPPAAGNGGGGGPRGLLRLASARKTGGNHASFQRLDDVTSSASDDAGAAAAASASGSFDVHHNAVLVAPSHGQRGGGGPTASNNVVVTAGTASAVLVAEDASNAARTEETTTSKTRNLGKKLKLKIKGTKTNFQKLENVEGSHGNCGYVPPSDYASFVGGTRDDALANPTLRLLQLASQSHYAQPSPHEDKPTNDERRTEKSSSVSKRDEDDHEPREEVEFRQFVFDKNFSSIEAVNVEKSDSGTANDDIFRMAAVETVTRMSLANFGSPSHKSSVLSPTNPQQKPSFKSPSRRSGGPKPYSPASGALPKSPTRRARALSAIPKVAPPGGTRFAAAPSGAASPAGTEGGSKAPSDASSVDDVCKKRFQDLVKRTGKLSVQSPLPSSPFTQDSPGRSGGAFGSSSRQAGVRASPSPSPQQTSKASNSYASTREGAKTGGTKDIPFNSRSRSGSGATPAATLSANPPEASPLGTRRHFGNSGGRRFAPKSSPLSSLQGSKTRSPQVKTSFPSGISAASVANATVSTGPDENQRVKVNVPAARQDPFRLPSTSHFVDDDNDDPFRIGQDDPWKDSAAWDVARVAFPAPRRREATPKTSTGSTSSASRGDNSLLIQSIRSAIHQKSRAARHRETQVHRPDPSPRGVPHSSSDSFLDFVPAKQGGRSGKGQMGEHDDIVTSKSDGAMDADHRTLGSVPSVSASPVTMARISQGRKPSSKAPSGVPEHAILASMLFRQTEVFQQNDKMEATDNQSHGPSSSELRSVQQKPIHRKYGPSTAATQAHHRFDVPAAVHTSSTASIVSSVTEEASVFYSKNLQASSYKSQAQTALNNYHSLRAKQGQQHQVKHQAPSVNTGSTQTQRGSHQQKQQPPPRKGASSSSSRKTTASSTGRPTWLDRVEEEHMRMFS